MKVKNLNGTPHKTTRSKRFGQPAPAAGSKLFAVLPLLVPNLGLLTAAASPDGRGILAFLTEFFQRRDLSILCCYGRRLKEAQGSNLLLQLDNVKDLGRLQDELHREADQFRPAPALAPHHFLELAVDVREDAVGLLFRVAQPLTERKGNFDYFAADGVDQALLSLGLDKLGVLPPWKVNIRARVMLPRTNLDDLHVELLQRLPEGCRVTFAERPNGFADTTTVGYFQVLSK